MTSDSLNVKLNNKLAGVLKKDKTGGIEFEYDENSNNTLSLSLPLKHNYIYKNTECRGFFNGLLPESENVRKMVGKKYGINYKNDFSLLKAIGYDCAGAVSFSDNKDEDLPEYFEIQGNILSDKELETFIKELPKKPLLTGADGIRLSLAGAQDKTAVVLIDNKVALPYKNVPTTHILKPSISYLQETVENEFICLNAAKKAGIETPKAEIRDVNGIKYFLIERYDRTEKENKIKRIHQEDFCQAMNIISANKYQADDGPDFKKCIEILRKTTKPAVEINKFVELMIFNYLIGNNDAHGKNFSILYKETGEIVFAPAYDILCSFVYPDLSKKMAMKIGGHYEANKILPEHFEKTANEIGINYAALRKIIKKQASSLPDILSDVIKIENNTIGNKILDKVSKHCAKTLERFKSA